ncbi:hypothetical protein [Microbacterium sp. NPDC056234]|uniref:hypothetical protein n=1 Tax=Microbacterium sp. NPDC056234 TaxID=3345757 RepID=UPI0035D6BAFD
MNENERHLTPRGAAFRRPYVLPSSAATGERSEAAMRELAQHGDPSMKDDGTAAKSAEHRGGERTLKIRWERFPDLATLAATASVCKSVEMNMAFHTMLRTQAHRGTKALGQETRKLATRHSFGRTTPARESVDRRTPAM